MPPPTLPVELITHILDLLHSSEPVPPYPYLYCCCLVSRTFLAPARAALYDTIRIKFITGGIQPDSMLLVRGLAVSIDLGLNVRIVVVNLGGCLVNEGVVFEVLRITFKACPRTTSVEVCGTHDQEADEVVQALSSGEIKLRWLLLRPDFAVDVTAILRSQEQLQHLCLPSDDQIGRAHV